MIALAVATLSLAIWLHLVLFHGRFWWASERDDRRLPPPPATWPAVVAVVPARDEADVVARSVGSLLAQDYAGSFRVVLVDDGSSDGTADVARAAAAEQGRADRLEVLRAAPLAAGWTGKLAAVAQGVAHATGERGGPTYLMLTDADIGHAPDALRKLVIRCEAKGLALASIMVKLHCATAAERALIPAFVFFFQMLHPFPTANDPRRRLAAGAGGCMLCNAAALERAGGIAAIRGALIDDCTLAALLKRQGPIWIGLTETSWSLRPYETVGQVGRMVSRSAYAQLGYSPWLLAGTLAGMLLVYVAPPVLAVVGHGWARGMGAAAWLLMALSFQPTLRLYRRSPLWGLALPAIGGAYCAFTLQSALDHWRGRGGMWKGRAQAQASDPRRAAA